MIRALSAVALTFSLMGCMQTSLSSLAHEKRHDMSTNTSIAAFSGNAGDVPSQWQPLIIHRNKKQTHYQLAEEQGKTILHAHAASASSALLQHVNIDPSPDPWLVWKWKIGSLIMPADNYRPETEDSPVRIILGFDGNKDDLPFADQIMFETAKVLTGHDFPYATLMYIWENKAPVGTIIDSTRSSRIKMLVAASGAEGVGAWQELKRNILEDYENAFGEKPGRLIGVGVLTDTDNTGETVEAWYGDIRLQKQQRIAASSK